MIVGLNSDLSVKLLKGNNRPIESEIVRLKNLSNIKSHNSYVIIEKDIINGNLFFEFNEKFDLIFLDPPFKDKNLKNILTSIAKEKLLNTNGIIIIHRHKSEKDTIPGDFKIIEEKKYGLSKIIFLN